MTLTDGHSDGHSALDFLLAHLTDPDIVVPLCRLLQAGHPVLMCYTAEVDKCFSHVRESDIALIHGMKILFASGFKAGRTHPLTSCYQDDIQEPIKLHLKQLARRKIRQYLLQRHFQTNLFHLVPQLPIPTPVREYLLYHVELDLSQAADIAQEALKYL